MSSTEAPAATTAYTPVITDLMRLVRAPFAPTAVFEEQAEKPTFWIPYALVSAFAVGLGILMAPFQQRMQVLMAQQAGRPAPGGSLVTTIVGAPIQTLIGALVGAGLLYAIVSVAGGTTSYKKMMSLVIFAWPVFLIQQALAVVMLRMRGLDSIANPMDIMVSLGVDNLLPADVQLGFFLRFFLAGIGPLLIWSIGVKAAGIGVYAKTGKGAAWTAATIYSLVLLALLSALGGFGMSMAMRAASAG